MKILYLYRSYALYYRRRTAAETLNITNYQDNDENVYPTVFATVTIPKFLPIPFKKYADQYMRTLRAGLKGN